MIMPKDSSVNFKVFFPPTNSAFHQIGTLFLKNQILKYWILSNTFLPISIDMIIRLFFNLFMWLSTLLDSKNLLPPQKNKIHKKESNSINICPSIKASDFILCLERKKNTIPDLGHRYIWVGTWDYSRKWLFMGIHVNHEEMWECLLY